MERRKTCWMGLENCATLYHRYWVHLGGTKVYLNRIALKDLCGSAGVKAVAMRKQQKWRDSKRPTAGHEDIRTCTLNRSRCIFCKWCWVRISQAHTTQQKLKTRHVAQCFILVTNLSFLFAAAGACIGIPGWSNFHVQIRVVADVSNGIVARSNGRGPRHWNDGNEWELGNELREDVQMALLLIYPSDKWDGIQKSLYWDAQVLKTTLHVVLTGHGTGWSNGCWQMWGSKRLG